VNSAPRAKRAMAPERAGTERPDRRVETLAPTGRLVRGRGTARVRTPVCACSVACAGRSELRPRRPQQATAHSPRGKKKPHAVKRKNRARTRLAIHSRHAVAKKRTTAQCPRGKKKEKEEMGRSPTESRRRATGPKLAGNKGKQGKRGKAPGRVGPPPFTGWRPPLAGKPRTRVPTRRIVCVAGARQAAAGRGGEDGGRQHS